MNCHKNSPKVITIYKFLITNRTHLLLVWRRETLHEVDRRRADDDHVLSTPPPAQSASADTHTAARLLSVCVEWN